MRKRTCSDSVSIVVNNFNTDKNQCYQQGSSIKRGTCPKRKGNVRKSGKETYSKRTTKTFK